MNKKDIFLTILIATYALSIFACCAAAGSKSCPSKCVTVKKIVSSPKCLNTSVTVKGVFKGGYSKIGPPPVTRSDFILEDKTGQIFVTGAFPVGLKRTDIGKTITIKGTVKKTAKTIIGKKKEIIYLEVK